MATGCSVRGPNVMAGYLRAEGGGRIEAPEDGWYDTGDIVRIGAEGHVVIVGRAKRFAKVGGEMVSLAAVEALAAEVWPGEPLGAAALACPRKGQKVVLAIANPAAGLEALRAHAREVGVAEIQLPSELRILRGDSGHGVGQDRFSTSATAAGSGRRRSRLVRSLQEIIVQLQDVLADMVGGAREAGALTLRHFARFRELEIGIKGPADFVSDADRESELLIRERLFARYPDWSLTGEEFPPVERGDREHRWLVDPIDGTTNFVNGMDYTISIALRRGTRDGGGGALQPGAGRDVHRDPRAAGRS